jgi:hypothetical protein
MNFQNGTMMDHHAIKLRLQTLKYLSSQFSSSLIHSEVEITFVFFAKDGSGLILPLPVRFQLTLTLELLLKQSLIVLKMKSHGLESSKNTLFYKLKTDLPQDHMDGQTLDIQDPKDHSIAQLVVTFASEELLQMLILKHACLLELTSQELMLKLCQDNGNSKLDHALVLNQVITCGLLDIYL